MSASRGRGRLQPRAGFRQQHNVPTTGVHPTMLKQARKSGQLNLSGRGLSDVPEEVWRINIDVPEEGRSVSLDNTEDRWWEQTDLTKLILASNHLTTISSGIEQLPALSVLDIHDNQLVALPDEIGSLTNLQKISLSHNKLAVLPKSMWKLSNLKSLHLEYNAMTEIDEDIGRLCYLEDLDLSNNKLQNLPDSVGYLTKVMKLNVANNSLSAIPPQLGEMSALRYLDLTHNQLTCLPVEVGNLSHLEQLYIRHNKLEALPLLAACTNLKELHVGNNCIRQLTGDMLRPLSKLAVLDMRDNKLSELPAEIAQMDGLERLDLTNNDLSGLPYEMGNMVKLKAIILDGNAMKGIRRDIVSRGTNELKKYLRSRVEVSDVPTEVSAVTKTEGQSGVIGGQDGVDAHTVSSTKVLEYSNKKASSIPAEIWSLAVDAGITTGNFSKNTLTELPTNLMITVDSLSHLNLGFNKISSLHPDIGLYLKLTTLDLRNNLLTDLPPELCSCQNLREVVIACNRLKKLPSVLYELSSVENILASDNQIGEIDVSGLQRLTKLTSLDLQNNDLMQVPPELGLCEGLRSLQLGGNPFRNPRPAILAKGTIALLEYLRSRIVT